jgi:hypothetical protein
MGMANTSTGFDVGCSVFSPTFTADYGEAMAGAKRSTNSSAAAR